MKTTFLFAVFVLCLMSVACAQYTTGSTNVTPPTKVNASIEVSKTGPETANVGDVFEIAITVNNPNIGAVTAYVQEYLGNVDPVDPLPNYTEISNESILAAQAPSLTWVVDIPAGSSKLISYKVKAKSVGQLSIGPTSVYVSGMKFYSKPLIVNVLCSQKEGCDESIGETPLTCPDKCGGSVNETVAVPPVLEVIPTPAISGPDVNAAKKPPSQAEIDEKTKPMLIIYAIIAIVILGFAFLAYQKMSKKPQKPDRIPT